MNSCLRPCFALQGTTWSDAPASSSEEEEEEEPESPPRGGSEGPADALAVALVAEDELG